MALHNLKITVIDGGTSSGNALGGSSSGNNSSGGGSGNSQNGGSGTSKTGGGLLSSVLNYNSTIKSWMKTNLSPATAFAVSQGASLLIQTGKEFANYYVSDIGRANGDSNYQAIVNRKVEVATEVTSVVQSTFSGMAAGSIAGPIGIAIGAVVGLASSAVSLGFKYAEKEREYQHELFEENTSQAYQLARANYSALTGRVR